VLPVQLREVLSLQLNAETVTQQRVGVVRAAPESACKQRAEHAFEPKEEMSSYVSMTCSSFSRNAAGVVNLQASARGVSSEQDCER
jgi:hypothetical protein